MADRLGDIKRRLGYLARTGISETPSARPEDPVRQQVDLGPDWNKVGEYIYSRQGTVPLDVSGPLELSPLGVEADPAEMLFFDTETTGLSSGAGTSIFLMGMAWLVPDGLAYEQVFLADFPGEPDFLERIDHRFSRDKLYVSYNGRTFDSHLLRTRYLMNARHVELLHQLDLLYMIRRFWRRILPDCTLGTAESVLLGVQRTQDIPGAEVPDAYFGFLRGEGVGRLDLVFEHNRQDIVSLVRLLYLVTGLLHGADFDPVDRAALGDYLLARGYQNGVAHLQRGFREGDAKAGHILSLHYKRQSRWSEAIEIWKEMASRHSVFAAIELAKYWEHRLRQPQGALTWLEETLGDLPVPEKMAENLRRRKARLRRKIAEAEGRGS